MKEMFCRIRKLCLEGADITQGGMEEVSSFWASLDVGWKEPWKTLEGESQVQRMGFVGTGQVADINCGTYAHK